MDMLTGAIFPLNTVIFPGGRVPLQIFEPRYLDMVKECVKQDIGFTIALLASGSEVSTSDSGIVEVHPVGTCCKIVDWEQLENGLLGIIAEGERRVRIIGTRVRADKLMIGEQEIIEEQPVRDSEDMRSLAALLEELEQHPLILRLGTRSDYNDPTSIIWSLCQLLPFTNEQKQILLESDDSELRVIELERMLREYQEREFLERRPG